MAGASRPSAVYLALVFCLGLGLAWVGWRVTELSQQVGDLQGRVDSLSTELSQADEALVQSQAAVQRVRDAADELSDTVDALGTQGVAEVLPALVQASQDLQDAVTDAEATVGNLPAPQAEEPDQPALVT